MALTSPLSVSTVTETDDGRVVMPALRREFRRSSGTSSMGSRTIILCIVKAWLVVDVEGEGSEDGGDVKEGKVGGRRNGR